MARITVEDCEKIVPNRFDLVVLAIQRARQLIAGDHPTMGKSDEKKTVIALKEIAAKTVSATDLKESAINSFRAFNPTDDLEDELDEVPEEDTYNQQLEMQAAAQDDNLTVVDEDEMKEEV